VSGDALFKNPITGIAGCCAREASGHVAAPPSNEMKVRRLTDAPQAGLAYHVEGGSVHHGESESSMSALGSKADIHRTIAEVRFNPESRHLVAR
jgi:hypothetical protein